MRFASLGSGSQGNGLVVEHDGYRVLVDCGFGLADCVHRLSRLGLEPRDLHAVLVTHEHEDHVGGVARFATKFALPVHMTAGTARGMESRFLDLELKLIEGFESFALGDLRIVPYPVPHDAREPSQFVFSAGNRRLGLLTDAGSVTTHMVGVLSGCNALLLECNHDMGLLREGRYPESLKRRISGRWGHLDNEAATRMLSAVRTDELQIVVGMHLSEQNNHPDLVRSSIEQVMGNFGAQITVASQEMGTPWISLPP